MLGGGTLLPERPRVVWDLGGVLAPEWDLTELCGPGRLLGPAGVDPERFAQGYWTDRLEYDRGRSAEQYWSTVGAVAGFAVGPGVAGQLAAADAALWARLPAESLELLADLRRAGTPLALLSNAPLPLGEAIRAAAWSAHFDAIVISADEKIVKPEAAIYRLVEQRLAAAGHAGSSSGLIFFDDRIANIQAAAAAGWQAHLWQGLDAAREVLRAAGALTPLD